MAVRDPEAGIAEAARRIAGARHVAVLTGAGVSAESGIPTFRGVGGLWQGRDAMTLATPEAFRADPALVWGFYNYRRGLVARAAPNAAHRALVDLAAKVPKLTLITQNVDCLHQRAGSVDVLELHGNLAEIRCSRCDWAEDREGEALPALPLCPACGALARPAVVWFGETLPDGALEDAMDAARGCDVLLVVGTSAVVYPAAGLITTPGRRGRFVVEVNPDATPASGHVDLSLRGAAGEILPRLVPT